MADEQDGSGFGAAPRTPPFTDRVINVVTGLEKADVALKDRRSRPRVPYDAFVGFLLISPTGDRGRPIVLRARDISVDGISVVGRQMIYPGSQGAMQLVRSDGSIALVGVVVISSRYIGQMRHQSGMAFIPMPASVSPSEFLDRDGRMILLDPLLRQNIDPKRVRGARRPVRVRSARR